MENQGMNEEKLREAISGYSPDDPIIRAITQILVGIIDDERDMAIQPNLTNEARAFNCGRVASVIDLAEYLEVLGWKTSLTSRKTHPSDD